MDSGSLTGSRFTMFDKTAVEDPHRTAHLLKITLAKLDIAKALRTEISDRLRDLEHVYHTSLALGKANSRLAMLPRLTTMLAQAHLLDRYILLTAKDCLLYESCLRGPVPTSYWQYWKNATLELATRTPNIHDYFLWRVSMEDYQLANDDEDVDEQRATVTGQLKLEFRRDSH